MLVHSSSTAPTSGYRSTRVSPASRISRSAAATSSCGSLPRMARVNSTPWSVPTTGVPAATPALCRCSPVSVFALMVRMATRREQALDEGRLQQARGRDRHAHVASDLGLVDREESAIGGDAFGAEIDE